MAAESRQRFGRIDALVNNAALYGGLTLTPFEQIPESQWDQVMAANVKGAWLCCKAVIPAMWEQAKGKIINNFLWHYLEWGALYIALRHSGQTINVDRGPITNR